MESRHRPDDRGRRTRRTRLDGKSVVQKRFAQDRSSWQPLEGAPLVGMVSRMTSQKGFDLLRDAFERIMQLDLQIVMLANGDTTFEAYFRDAQRRYPGEIPHAERIRQRPRAQDSGRQRRVSDALALRAVRPHPDVCDEVRHSAGRARDRRLRDTVSEFDPKTGKGNGFVFEPYRAEDLFAALGRMISLVWQSRAMAQADGELFCRRLLLGKIRAHLP